MFLDPDAYGKAAAMRVIFFYLILSPFYLLVALTSNFSTEKLVTVILGFILLSFFIYLGTFFWYWFFAKLYNKYVNKNQRDSQE